MNDESNKTLDALALILLHTQSGKIKWEITDIVWNQIVSADETIDVAFETDYQGRNLVIYVKRYKDKRFVEGYFQNSLPKNIDFEDFWKSRVVLEIYDNDIPVYSFPQYAAKVLLDLYSAVKYQVADIGGFIGNVLDDAPPS